MFSASVKAGGWLRSIISRSVPYWLSSCVAPTCKNRCEARRVAGKYAMIWVGAGGDVGVDVDGIGVGSGVRVAVVGASSIPGDSGG